MRLTKNLSFDKRLEKDDTEYREILQRLERLAGELKEERLSKCFEKGRDLELNRA